ncbi:MAG TPA: isochorismatase family protein [Bryobacteraceae bacterium]|jgi:nicotinamidase-related amidase
MLKPITVTSTTLSTDTKRSGFMGTFGWRSKEMKAVIIALNAFHAGKTGAGAVVLEGGLMGAVATWRDKQPNEFANRDRISGGLCTKLAIEVGISELRKETIKSFQLIGMRNDAPTTRQIPRVVLGFLPVHEAMIGLSQHIRLGVILIDVQNREVAQVDQRWNGVATILDNMCDVLDKANEMDLPVMEFWMAERAEADLAKQGTLRELSQRLRNRANVTTEKKPTHNAFEGTGLATWLERNRLVGGSCVVMGYNANQCVGATIFGGVGRPTARGTPYIPGLLDRGVNVLSSRGILASGGFHLSASEGWPYIGLCSKI